MKEGSKVCASIVRCSSHNTTITFNSFALFTLVALNQFVSSLTKAERNLLELPLTYNLIPNTVRVRFRVGDRVI
jgi:hypothetical protein